MKILDSDSRYETCFVPIGIFIEASGRRREKGLHQKICCVRGDL